MSKFDKSNLQTRAMAPVAALGLAGSLLLSSLNAHAGLFDGVGNAIGSAAGDLFGGAVSGIAGAAGEALGNAAVSGIQGVVTAGANFITGQPEHGGNTIDGKLESTQIVDVKSGIDVVGAVVHFNRAALKDCEITGDVTILQELHANRVEVHLGMALINDLRLVEVTARSVDAKQIMNTENVTVTGGALLANVAYGNDTEIGGDLIIHQQIDVPSINLTAGVLGLNELYF